ncbi:MAG: hypothetical protein ACXIVL_10210 [Oceanicaulis sp.]
MSLLIALISAAALNAAPALAGAAHGHGEAESWQPPRSPYDHVAPDARPAPHAGHASAHRHHHAPLPAPSPRAVRLSPDFFYGPLTGGVERPPVRLYTVRQGYVIHHAPSGPVSAGQAASARGLGQGGSG